MSNRTKKVLALGLGLDGQNNLIPNGILIKDCLKSESGIDVRVYTTDRYIHYKRNKRLVNYAKDLLEIFFTAWKYDAVYTYEYFIWIDLFTAEQRNNNAIYGSHYKLNWHLNYALKRDKVFTASKQVIVAENSEYTHTIILQRGRKLLK